MPSGEANHGPLLAMASYAAVAVAASGWGTWPLILRYATNVDPALQSVIVMAVLTLVSGVFVLKDRHTFARTPKQWLAMAWLGAGDALNILLFFAAYRRTTVAVAVLTHYLTPIFVAIAAPLVLRERATLRTAIAVAVAFFGLILILPWGQSGASNVCVGAALGAGSAVFYASNVLVNKGIARAFTTSESMFYHGVVSVLVLVLFVPRAAWANVDTHGCAIVALGGVGPGAASGLLFVWGLRGMPANHASTLTLLEPLVATLAGVAMGEALGPRAVVGGLLILGGGALVVLEKKPDDGAALADPPAVR